MLELRKPHELRDPEKYVTASISWVLSAGSPYFPELFGGEEPAMRALDQWMRRSTSEVSIRRSILLMAGSDVAGGFIGLSGAELRQARKADTVALPKTVTANELRAVMVRMANGANLFSPVSDDEYYLSKLGLNPQFRGAGLGRRLIEGFLEEGRSGGFHHYCLEVRSDNEPALRLYRSAGFEADRQLQSRDGRFRYFAMRLSSE